MAAAPNYPMRDAAVTSTVTIDDAFNPTPQGLIVYPGDTVAFENNSGADITIQFAPNYTSPVLSANLTVNNGTTVSFPTPNVAAAANYYIYVGATQMSGPWVIQVGSGPMYAIFSGPLACNFPTVAVPIGSITTGMGMLNIGANLTSSSLGIRFPSNPFNPPIATNDGSHPIKVGTSAGSYGYTLVVPLENPGPGTVIVRGT
jgi:hypothetical protein